MLQFIGTIPDIVWAASLASILTLTGVILSNRNSRKQALAQLKHDSHQRDRERNMILRKEVYLPAAEAISKGITILTELVELNLSTQEVKENLSSYSAAISKIQIVGSNNTVQATSAFSQKLVSSFLELIVIRAPLLDRKNEIEIRTNFINKTQSELDRYIKLMKDANLAGNTDQRIWDSLNRSVEYEQKQNERYIKERSELTSIQDKKLANFFELCVLKQAEVSRLIPTAIFAIREELEMSIDKDAYLASFNAGLKENNKIFQDFLNDAKALTNKESDSASSEKT